MRMNRKFLMFMCIFAFFTMFVGFAQLTTQLDIRGIISACPIYHNILFDGKTDDSIWTDDVMANGIDNNRQDGEVFVDIYATRTDQDVVFFANYYTRTLATNWQAWDGYDNIELRIVTNNNTWTVNGLEKDNFSDSSVNKNRYYVSAYKNGVGNVSMYYVSTPVYNNSTNFYEINFEFCISYSDILSSSDYSSGVNNGGTYTSSITKDTPLAFHVGSNIQSGSFYTFNWTNSTFTENFLISSKGITKSSNLINERIHENTSSSTYTNGWNSNIYKISMDGTSSFEVQFEFNNFGTAVSGSYDRNWVCDISSVGWVDGGWTIRSDWWGWGSWADNDNATYQYPTSDSDIQSWLSDFHTYSTNMYVTMNVKFDASTGIIQVNLLYESHYGNWANVFKSLVYTCNNVTYRGDFVIGLGASYAEISLNSVKVISGIVRTTPENFEVLSGTLIEYDGTVDRYLKYAYAYSDHTVALLKDSTLKSGTFNADITSIQSKNKGGSELEDYMVGIIFGYSNNSCYRMYINKDRNKLIVDKIVYGVVYNLYSTDISNFDNDTQYSYKVTLTNNTYTCYFNNTQYHSFQKELSGDRVGVFGSRLAKFKNCAVS